MRTFLAAVIALILCGTAVAENYSLTVTRKGSNLYKVDGKNILIQTRYCYVYAYSEESIYKSTGYGEICIDSKDNCDVKAVYGVSNQAPGKYTVTVSREADDLYEVFGVGVFIKTTMCLSLALGEEAFLILDAGGIGRLIFKGGDSCMVEGLYSKVRL